MRPEPGKIQLERASLADLPGFTMRIQEAFSIAVEEKYGVTEPIPAAQEVRAAFLVPGGVAYHLVWNGQRVGGAVLTIAEITQPNALSLFFISPEFHSHGLGLAAWQAIEAAYPQTAVWETITPYFEQRNIHFYVNKCGFHIVEFFNAHHQDPHLPPPETPSGEQVPGTEAYFRFEKIMR